MGYHFPDTRAALRRIAAPFGTTYSFLAKGWDANLPAILVYRTGGTEEGPLREDRIQVEVYGRGSTKANDVAMGLHEHLTGRPHEVDGELIDGITPLVIPAEVPYDHEEINLVVASYRVSTRGH